MQLLNFIHYYEYALGIDIDRLGKAYLDIKKHLSFNRDDKNKIDFNAICVNRIPGDENSITGGNIEDYIGHILILIITKNKD